VIDDLDSISLRDPSGISGDGLRENILDLEKLMSNPISPSEAAKSSAAAGTRVVLCRLGLGKSPGESGSVGFGGLWETSHED
jgi:hypothetical protein